MELAVHMEEIIGIGLATYSKRPPQPTKTQRLRNFLSAAVSRFVDTGLADYVVSLRSRRLWAKTKCLRCFLSAAVSPFMDTELAVPFWMSTTCSIHLKGAGSSRILRDATPAHYCGPRRSAFVASCLRPYRILWTCAAGIHRRFGRRNNRKERPRRRIPVRELRSVFKKHKYAAMEPAPHQTLLLVAYCGIHGRHLTGRPAPYEGGEQAGEPTGEQAGEQAVRSTVASTSGPGSHRLITPGERMVDVQLPPAARLPAAVLIYAHVGFWDSSVSHGHVVCRPSITPGHLHARPTSCGIHGRHVIAIHPDRAQSTYTARPRAAYCGIHGRNVTGRPVTYEGPYDASPSYPAQADCRDSSMSHCQPF